MAVIGLSGGGPYALACAAALPDRVVAAGVLGGVAPTRGADAISGGRDESRHAGGAAAGVRRRSAADRREPAGPGGIRPVASPALDLYAAVSPEADRHLLTRPEFKAMFLDDLLNGSRKQLAAPFNDVILFARDWGFRLDEVKVPVRWWHGDHDHIIPFAHGEHVVSRLPDAELFHPAGAKAISPGWAAARRSCPRLMKIWDEQA